MRRIKGEEESIERGRTKFDRKRKTKFKEEVGETGKKRRRIKEMEESVERGRTEFTEEEILDNFSPTSLLKKKKLGYDGAERPRSRSISRSGSGASASGAGTGATIYVTGGIVDTEADQVVNIVCSMLERGLISANEMREILNLVDEWFKERGVWWSFMLSSTPSLEVKTQILKDCLPKY